MSPASDRYACVVDGLFSQVLPTPVSIKSGFRVRAGYLSPRPLGLMIIYHTWPTQTYGPLFRIPGVAALQDAGSPDALACLIGCFSRRVPRRQFVDLNRWRSPIRKRANEWEKWELECSKSSFLPQDTQLILEHRYKTHTTLVLRGEGKEGGA